MSCSYELMSVAIRKSREVGVDKWEYFKYLREFWCNREMLARAVMPLASSELTLYSMPCHTFPLCDSPVMFARDSVMAVLSPRLLLEIKPKRAETRKLFASRARSTEAQAGGVPASECRQQF